jgi:Phycobilisome degradation protein nblA
MEMNHLSQSLKLTLEQEFQLRLVEESAQEISHEEALSLLIQTSKLLMIKDNVIRSLMKDSVLI